MIDYPVDVNNTLWSVLDTSNGEIISRNKKWPVLDGSEIPGADPRYVYLLQTASAKPDYDSRTHILQQVETADEQANTLSYSYSSIKRPIEEITSSIENEEQDALESLLPNTRRNKILLLGMTVLFRSIDGLSLNTKEQAIADEIVSLGVKVWKNDSTLRSKIKDLADGNEPDLSSGWEKE